MQQMKEMEVFYYHCDGDVTNDQYQDKKEDKKFKKKRLKTPNIFSVTSSFGFYPTCKSVKEMQHKQVKTLKATVCVSR